MKFFRFITILFVFFGIFPISNSAYSESQNPKNYKILSSTNKKLSIANVESFIKEGDKLIKSGDFEKAKNTYDKARDLAKKLALFYRDLNGSFIGIDARIPIEMGKKGKNSTKIWAKSNARLAALYIRKKEPEVAVPLLVEIIRLMTPNSSEGKEAYKNLLELGFVETSYKGF